ncbi:hypothetical protein KKF84_07325, partial [Myxococcota bacterium]|nr:hypothetical protein [Myxococcota bacterium]MBU1535114.1 hypothetical protein [Myxococcota bacterium]
MKKLCALISLLSLLVVAVSCDDDATNTTECETGETRNGTVMCGLNNEGVLLQSCQDGAFVDTTICTGTDICTNDATQVGETPCNETGFYIQLCGQGAWADTTDCTVTITGCTPDATQVGTTVCGLNDEGFIVQVCSGTGVWQDSWECTGTDECINGARQEGTTPCNDTGVIYQDCSAGTWVDS